MSTYHDHRLCYRVAVRLANEQLQYPVISARTTAEARLRAMHLYPGGEIVGVEQAPKYPVNDTSAVTAA